VTLTPQEGRHLAGLPHAARDPLL